MCVYAFVWGCWSCIEWILRLQIRDRNSQIHRLFHFREEEPSSSSFRKIDFLWRIQLLTCNIAFLASYLSICRRRRTSPKAEKPRQRMRKRKIRRRDHAISSSASREKIKNRDRGIRAWVKIPIRIDSRVQVIMNSLFEMYEESRAKRKSISHPHFQSFMQIY